MSLIPTYRLMLKYDVHPERYEIYFRYISREFVPLLQQMGLHMIFAWQVYGDHPERQIEFVCEDDETLRTALMSDRFQKAEERLKSYTTFYTRKVVHFHNRYQF